mmetsp:Transcript_8671/g.12948  ORF Transcript_8671/g.12948 Transcript_8671/m.12948 type:complete len:339 (-) Transcript_8671:36-1052(-)
MDFISALSGHTEDRVWHVSWSKDGNYLASCGEDRTIRIWKAKNHDWEESGIICIATLEEGQSRTLRCCEWSPDGRMLASASFDGTVVIWESQDRSNSNWDMIASLEGHENEVKCVCWSPSGQWIATCGRDKSVWVWENLGRGEFECVTVLSGHSQDVKFVIFHPLDSATLFSCSYDDTVKVWKEEGDDWYCSETLSGHGSTVWGVALNRDGDRMVSCGADLGVLSWEYIGRPRDADPSAHEWMQSASLRGLHRYPIYSIDWSKEHGNVITGGGDNCISLCRVGDECGTDKGALAKEFQIEEAHDGDVNCVRWNPAANAAHICATCGDDSLVKLWKLRY